MASVRRSLTVFLASAALIAVVVGVCQATTRSTGEEGSDYDLAAALAAVSDAPPPLRALHKQAARVISGDAPKLDAQLRKLRGYPVVVNVWASWCGPCREEFPLLQRAARRWGTRVAFLGVATRDTRSAAQAFVDRMPLPYPTLLDPADGPMLERLRVPRGPVPVTVFLNGDGKREFMRSGSYASEEQLNTDIERYLTP